MSWLLQQTFALVAYGYGEKFTQFWSRYVSYRKVKLITLLLPFLTDESSTSGFRFVYLLAWNARNCDINIGNNVAYIFLFLSQTQALLRCFRNANEKKERKKEKHPVMQPFEVGGEGYTTQTKAALRWRDREGIFRYTLYLRLSLHAFQHNQ